MKRDYHPEVWSVLEGQLGRFYTIDPEAKGFGIYVVFWFGAGPPTPIPPPPNGLPRPESAADMEQMVRDLISADKKNRLAVAVIDVSGAAHRS